VRTSNPWGNPGDLRITELAEKGFEIFGRAGNVGVDKCHERRCHVSGAKIASTARSERGVRAQEPGPMRSANASEG